VRTAVVCRSPTVDGGALRTTRPTILIKQIRPVLSRPLWRPARRGKVPAGMSRSNVPVQGTTKLYTIAPMGARGSQKLKS